MPTTQHPPALHEWHAWAGHAPTMLPTYDTGMPLRYPFLLVDRVVEWEKEKYAVGYKNVTVNDNFFTGHFPERPIMPGVWGAGP